MTDPTTSLLPPDVLDALSEERARPSIDSVTRARLRARLHASLHAGGSGGLGSPHEGAPSSRATTPSAPRGLLRTLRSAHPLATAAIGFAIGVTTGVAIESRFGARASEPRDPQHAQSSLTVPEVTAGGGQPTPNGAPTLAIPEVLAPSHAGRAAPSAPTFVPSGSALTAERALLDVAHSALAKGQAADALSALAQHSRAFSHGVYREEREALTIQCLRALGRTEEAARLAVAFKTRYPRSLFLSTVDRDTATNP